MNTTKKIRPARPEDANTLTEISISSKKVWQYPDYYIEIWRKELTITPRYIHANAVFIAEVDTIPVGYYSIVYNPSDRFAGDVFIHQGHWLEHLFVKPGKINQGIGTRLMVHAKEYCRKNNIQTLSIFADPHSKGFYEKIGAQYIKDSPSNIAGRTIPVFELTI